LVYVSFWKYFLLNNKTSCKITIFLNLYRRINEESQYDRLVATENVNRDDVDYILVADRKGRRSIWWSRVRQQYHFACIRAFWCILDSRSLRRYPLHALSTD